MIIHIIRPGETLLDVSRAYNVPLHKILNSNKFLDPDISIPGQSIIVPDVSPIHIVNQGENLWMIAQKYKSSINALIEENRLSKSLPLYPGQKLKIPIAKNVFGSISVNAYIESSYNGNEKNILKEAAPYLTYLSIFGYGVKPDGNLTPINDMELIRLARENGVAPLMVLTNFTNGVFRSDLLHSILSNENIHKNLIDNIVKTLLKKNYSGINIDFERIAPEDKKLYSDFIQNLQQRLSHTGHILTAAIPPKLSGDSVDSHYISHDYQTYGKLIDHAMLMTYEWGWYGGPPMPISPLNQINVAVDYACSIISRDKIMMGMPLYGYDWVLPHIPGKNYAKALSLEASIFLAQQQNTVIHYDNISKSPYFTYLDGEKNPHIVWFEDARSILAKYEMVYQLGLGGISFWSLRWPSQHTWVMLENLFYIKKLL